MRAVLAAATAIALGASATSASALVVPPMGVTVDGEGTSQFELCGFGNSTSRINEWRLTVEGFRSTGGPVVVAPIEGSGGSFHECVTISKAGADTGALVVTLTFVGIGPDAAGTFSGYARWAPGQPDDTFESGIT